MFEISEPLSTTPLQILEGFHALLLNLRSHNPQTRTPA